MNLKVVVLQQDGLKLLVHYTGNFNENEASFFVDRKIKITLPTLASIDIVKEAIRLGVKNDFLRTKYVGFEFDMSVSADLGDGKFTRNTEEIEEEV